MSPFVCGIRSSVYTAIMVKQIKIVIRPLPTEGYFLAGSTISGKVVVKTGSKKSYYTKLDLALTGTIESSFADRENGTKCRYSEEILRVPCTLWEKSDASDKFPKGESHWTFSLAIPATLNVLPTCENKQTRVSYSLSVAIAKEKRGKEDSATSVPVTIFPSVEASSPDMQVPQSAHNVTPLKSCLCLAGGSIETEVRLPRKGFEVEEIMEFEVEIDNGTRKRISHFDAVLVQKIICAGSPKSIFGRRNDTLFLYGEEANYIGDRVTSRSGVIARSSWAENLLVQVPSSTPPTFESTDSILKVEHYLLVRVHVASSRDDPITLKCPIIIGNCQTQVQQVSAADTGAAPSYSGLEPPPPDFSDFANNPPPYFDTLQSGGGGGIEPPTAAITDYNRSSSVAVPSAPSLPRDSFLQAF